MNKIILSIICLVVSISSVNACEKVSDYYLNPEVILSQTYRAYGMQVLDARAVRSKDFKNFYFVQYKMNHPKHGDIFPTFAMNKPFKTGSVIYSMDDVAIEMSGFGDGRKTKAKFSHSSNGYKDVIKCLK